MTAYLVVLTLLFLLSLFAVYAPKYRQPLGFASTTILVLFAGLKYQTGYDWPAYEEYYRVIVGFKGYMCEGLPALPILAEPLYMYLNVFLKSLSFNNTAFFFTISVINLGLIHYVTSKISRSSVFVWIIYFGLAFLLAQMTTIRQGIASSFVLLALFFAAENKIGKSIFFQILSIGFQVSAVIFTPLLFLKKWLPKPRWVITFLVFGAVITLLKINIYTYLFKLFFDISPLWIASKLQYYAAVSPSAISLGSLGLAFYHLAMLITFYKAKKTQENSDEKLNIAIWLTLASLTGHLYFSNFPMLWNRIMLVSIPWQIAAFYRLDLVKKMTPKLNALVVTVFFLISGSALIYTLEKPKSLPFTPYYSVLDPWLGIVHKEDGYQRLKRAMELESDIRIGQLYGDLSPQDTSALSSIKPPLKNIFIPSIRKQIELLCQ